MTEVGTTAGGKTGGASRIDSGSESRTRTLRRFRYVAVLGPLLAGISLGVAYLVLGGDSRAPSVFLLGLVFFLAMSVFGWLIFGRASKTIAEEVSIDDAGVHARMPMGRMLDLAWSDERFALNLTYGVSTPGTPQPVFLTWGPYANVATANLTPAGAHVLRSQARGQGLTEAVTLKGRPPRTWTVVELRPASRNAGGKTADPAPFGGSPGMVGSPPGGPSFPPPPPPIPPAPSVTASGPSPGAPPAGPPQLRRCMRCQALATFRMRFCSNCGAPLG